MEDPMQLSLQTNTLGRWTVVSVVGELDLHSSPALREHVLELLASGVTHVALDLSGVDFMDSSTLGVLVTCLKRVREDDGRLVLVGVASTPMKVLTLTGLDRIFEMTDSVTELPEA
jgi:anti-sigma B factor antagonist